MPLPQRLPDGPRTSKPTGCGPDPTFYPAEARLRRIRWSAQWPRSQPDHVPPKGSERIQRSSAVFSFGAEPLLKRGRDDPHHRGGSLVFPAWDHNHLAAGELAKRSVHHEIGIEPQKMRNLARVEPHCVVKFGDGKSGAECLDPDRRVACFELEREARCEAVHPGLGRAITHVANTLTESGD